MRRIEGDPPEPVARLVRAPAGARVVGADDVTRAKKVQVGGLRYGLRVIYAGLTAEDRVIIGGPPVLPGTKVSPNDGTIVPGSDEGSN